MCCRLDHWCELIMQSYAIAQKTIMAEGKPKLRVITYLAPSHPVEFYETVLHYLEEVLDIEGYLIYESRWSGPSPQRKDPFSTNDVDLGFMCITALQRLLNEKNPYVELCEAAPVYKHAKNNNRAVYFSDVIINTNNSKNFKEFHDLKGRGWAYNDQLSLSGNLAVLGHLKEQGTNAAFFGNVLQSGSHLNSLRMILDNTVDAAAVDSFSLATWLRKHPEQRKDITILKSIGPLPAPPVVFNKKLPDDMKKKITDALLKMHENVEWNTKLQNLLVDKFCPIDMSHYGLSLSLTELVKGLTIQPAYY